MNTRVQEPDGDRHALVGGSRWHYPKMGSPTECGVEGCDRVLGAVSDDVDEQGASDD